jgi:hypothetical protein
MSLRRSTRRAGGLCPARRLRVTSRSVQPGCRAAAPGVVPRRVRNTVSEPISRRRFTRRHGGPPRAGFSLRPCLLHAGAPDARHALMLAPVAVPSVSHCSSPDRAPRQLRHRDQRIPVSPTAPTATAPGLAASDPPSIGNTSRDAPLFQASAESIAPPTTAWSPTVGGHLPLGTRPAGRFQRSTLSQPLRPSVCAPAPRP